MHNRSLNPIKRILELQKGRRAVLVAYDILCFALVAAVYLWLHRVVSGAAALPRGALLWCAAVQLVLIQIARFLFGCYHTILRYSSARAYATLVAADVAGSLAALILSLLLGFYGILWQFVILGAVNLVAALFSRFLYCILYKRNERLSGQQLCTPVAIIGAGRIGTYLADDLRNNPHSEYAPLFYIDNDPMKVGNRIGDLRIYDPEAGAKLIEKLQIDTVVISISSMDNKHLLPLYNRYSALGCKVKVCDSLVRSDELEQKPGKIREFRIEDILFRKPIDLRNSDVRTFYQGKTVLITGGGGSIGSELSRQIAACSPRQLVIFDIYENNAYDIQQELLALYGDSLDLAIEIGSVRDVRRLDELFARYRPDVVFHAAAHKHVPLMEHCGGEAVKNNVLGTQYTADAAEKYGAQKFILISTDKAVNPTNVMGASKRLCEMIVQCRDDSKTSFAAVRFGNVLGSNGSVVPLFKRQIDEGGPVTVTDRRIIRYFMTIPEASQLVLHAGAMAKRGELYVLDMGKPVKIYDLAVSMIRLSGLVPNKDIRIEEIGLRPGEKLYEELLMKSEELEKTENDLIFIERDAHLSRAEVQAKIDFLIRAMETGMEMQTAMQQVIPTYHRPEEVNRHAEESDEMKFVSPVA